MDRQRFFGAGISLSVKQLDPSPPKDASCLTVGNSHYFYGLIRAL